MITFKTELHIRIYKETGHQDDNDNNYSSFHGASKCENILEKRSASLAISAEGT